MRETIAEWAFGASSVMMTLVMFAALAFPIGFVLSIFRRTRPWTGAFLVFFSYLLGAATWFYGAAVSFAAFGWIGLFLGLVMAGIGVVPLGIVGGFMEEPAVAWGLILMLVATFAFRGVGAWLVESSSNSPSPEPLAKIGNRPGFLCRKPQGEGRSVGGT